MPQQYLLTWLKNLKIEILAALDISRRHIFKVCKGGLCNFFLSFNWYNCCGIVR
jgi:hypothetical protein